MSKNGIASCKEDLMVLKHFNLETPNHLLAKKYSLDRHTIQKYMKENLFNEQIVLKNETFRYLQYKYLNTYENLNQRLKSNHHSSFQKSELSDEENDIILSFFEASSALEIADTYSQIKQDASNEDIDLLEGIDVVDWTDIRKNIVALKNEKNKSIDVFQSIKNSTEVKYFSALNEELFIKTDDLKGKEKMRERGIGNLQSNKSKSSVQIPTAHFYKSRHLAVQA